jgi:hypothetical protein
MYLEDVVIYEHDCLRKSTSERVAGGDA